jgi:GGDEF domain-containing protein
MYLRAGEAAVGLDQGVLYCDPLTSLVAYPSFEQYLIEMLPTLVTGEMHIAIGDVDGLREYVSERKADDPCSFGHLAGNACMRKVGALTSEWAATRLKDVRFHLCGTFGGDEVIVAAAGLSHDSFAGKIHDLCHEIKVSSPRPCSFALATVGPCVVPRHQARIAYRRFVSVIDACLFSMKENARLAGGQLEGAVVDLGIVSVSDGGPDQDGIGHLATIGGGR